MGDREGRLRGKALDAYEACAVAYDDLTAHHDFGLWLASLMPELERHGLQGNRLLDVACGTGNSFLEMVARGWEVVGCDISPAMIELAEGKVDASVRLAVADMRELPSFGEFDLVWALTDPLNYLLDAGELGMALDGMRRNLAAGGLVVFDLNTLRMYRTEFAETEMVEGENGRLVWEGRTADDVAPGSLCEARLGYEADDRAASVHLQRHFTVEVALEALGESGLECLEVFGHVEDAIFRQPLDELRHLKAIYIARSKKH
jgi:SAM-dependent methyltransferase